MKVLEEVIIELLTSYPPSTSGWHEPINAITRATGLTTAEARRYAEDLRNRGVVLPFSIVADGKEGWPQFKWARPYTTAGNRPDGR